MRRLPLAALLAVTLGSTAFVAAGLPGLASVPGWFYRPMARGLGDALPLAVGAVAVPALVWLAFVWTRRRRSIRAAAALTVAALIAQVALVLGDARGVEDAFRWQSHGHGEMARIAHRWDRPLPDTLRSYEGLVDRRELGDFTPSKPPGAFALYVGVDGLADALSVRSWLGPLVEAAAEDPRLQGRAETAALSFVLFPLATALAVPLVFALGTLVFGGREAGCAAAVLTLSAPAFLLIQQHLDGAVYPALALATCTLVARAGRRAAPWWAALGGGVWGASLYVSFSLLPVVGLVVAVLALLALHRIRGGEDRLMELHRAGWHLGAFGVGALAVLWALAIGLDFELAHRLESALEYHARWKVGVPAGPWRLWSLVEFTLYLGPPLAFALLWRAVGDAVALAAQWFQPGRLAPVGMVAFLLILAAAAGTNEVARLWLFLVPFVAAVVAAETRTMARGGRWWTPVGWLAACQGVLAVVLQANQMW